MASNTPENKVKAWVKKLLDHYIHAGEPVTYFSVMPSPYTTRGVSDFVVIIQGLCVCLEIKARGRKPTDIQAYFGKRVEEAGGEYIVVAGSDDETKKGLETKLRSILNCGGVDKC